jgi:hypothetical protein
VSPVEQELLTLPEHLSSSHFLVGFMLLDLQFYVYGKNISLRLPELTLLIVVKNYLNA